MQQLKVPKFKIRCSAIGKLMSGKVVRFTESDNDRLAELYYERDNLINKNGNKVKWTVNKQKELSALLDRKSKPDELPTGAKTYCDKWIKSKLYNRRKNFTSKYTTKGNLVEDESILFAERMLDLGFIVKNEDRFYDECMHGEPDVIRETEIIDLKNSYDFDTFPLFDTDIDTDYWWQGQGYMNLTGKENYRLVYCLMNTPDIIIHQEARRKAYNDGEPEMIDEYYEELKLTMRYDDIDDRMRIKVFEFSRDNEAISKIAYRVGLARTYIEQRLMSIEPLLRKELTYQ